MWNLVKVATTQRWIVECPLSATAQPWLSKFRPGFTFLSPIHLHLDFFQLHFYFSSTSFNFPAQILLFKHKLYLSITNNISKPKLFYFSSPFQHGFQHYFFQPCFTFFSPIQPQTDLFSLILTFLAKNFNFQTQFAPFFLQFSSIDFYLKAKVKLFNPNFYFFRPSFLVYFSSISFIFLFQVTLFQARFHLYGHFIPKVTF